MKRHFAWSFGALPALLAVLFAAPAVARSQAMAAPAPPAAQVQTYSDSDVRRYIAARDEIRRLTPGSTFQEQRQNQIRIVQILQSHGFTAQTYIALDTLAKNNTPFRNHVAALSLNGPISDHELQAFAAASLEIAPISASLADATPAQRATASQQIHAILDRYGIAFEAYNGIATRAQTDQALAARIAAAQIDIHRSEKAG